MMHRLFFIASMTIAITSSLYGQDDSSESPITLEELNRRNVVGNLGIRLGTVVEIEAEIVAGKTLRQKQYVGKYLLRVTQVDGKDVSDMPLMQFSVPAFADVRLANHEFALYEWKNGTKAERLNSGQIEDLENGYVGKKVRLVVYEVGRFHGIPNGKPHDTPTWADVPFQFSTALSVLKELEHESNPKRSK